jgi:thioester reductase-like protein
MSEKGQHAADHLTPQEKRALLAELLKKKAEARGRPSQDPLKKKRLGSFDRFTASSMELASEVILDPSIYRDGLPFDPQAEHAHILLTGATGFLGAFLLHELLEKTRAEIYCLVRCTDEEDGRARLLARLEGYLPGVRHEVSRIIPVPGDLSQPQLGLTVEGFQMLAGKIDAVYHSAAMVNWIYSYEQLKPANVNGIREILKLTSQVKIKPLHYVSTLAVFPLVGNAEASVAREDDTLDHGGALHGGYTQSKWVAEKLVMLARSRGLPVAIYRPGMITGHSRTGAWNTSDFTCQMLKSWVNAGFVPDLDAAMDMTPVDYVSSAIVQLSRSEGYLGQVFHLANPKPVDVQRLYAFMRSFGYGLEPVPYNQWRATLIALAERTEEKAVRSLTPILSVEESEGAPRWVGGVPRFDCTNTLNALAHTGIRCPPVDEAVLNTYFTYLTRSGFLKAPHV